MPFPDPELAARRASMQAEQASRQRMVRKVNVGTGQLEDEVLEAPTLAQGGFDIYHPYAGTEQIAYRGRDGKVSLVSPDGTHVMVPDYEAQTYADKGYQVESPADYWSRKENEARENATGQAFMGSFVSGLSFGASDYALRERYGEAAAAREADIRGRSPVASTLGEVTGAAASMALPVEPIGALAGKALAAGARAGSYGGRFIGLTRRAEAAAEAATAAARKAVARDVASELALYKRLPSTPTERAALLQEQVARLGAEETRLTELAGSIQVPDVAPVGVTAEAARKAATAARKAAERAAATAEVRGEAALQVRPTAEVATKGGPVDDLIAAAAGPNRKGRIKPAEVSKRVKALGLPETEAADLAEALSVERGFQKQVTWFRDKIQPLVEKSFAKGEAALTDKQKSQIHAYRHENERLIARQAALAGRRASAGRPSAPDVESILTTFGGTSGKVPELPAATPRATRAAEAEAAAAEQLAARAEEAERAAALAGEKTAAETGARAAAEAKAALTAELEEALSVGRMPDFLRPKAGATLGPSAPPYTREAGERWLAGEGLPKTSSRIASERWSPGGDWTIPRGAPSFPREAAPVVPADIASSVGGIMGRGAFEGGAFAGGRELSRQALGGGDYDPVEIAVHAVQGAALGSLVSLAGAGISSVAGKVSGGIKQAVARRAGVDTSRLDILLARERIVKARLEHLAESPLRESNVTALRALRKEIFNARAEVFEAGGRLLQGMSGVLGNAPLAWGASIPNMLLGTVGGGAARILTSGIVKRAGVAAGRAAGAVTKGLPFAGKVAGLSIVDTLTEDEMGSLAEQLEMTQAADVGLAALRGYQAAGMDAKLAGFLADYQSRRVDLLKLTIVSPGARNTSTGRVLATRVLNAVEDPRRITERLARGEVYTEDLLVLQVLFPDFYKDLARQARALLKRRGLTARQQLTLKQIAGDASHAAVVDAIQKALLPVPQEGQGARRSYNTGDAATESQRLQGEQR